LRGINACKGDWNLKLDSGGESGRMWGEKR
jgi:hypothetical protein